MSRGMPTPVDQAEAARAAVAVTGNKTEAAKRVGLPRETVRNIVNSNPDEFEEYRKEVQLSYIDRTWNQLNDLQQILTEKLKSIRPTAVQLREITGAMRDLKATVDNIHQQLIQVNVQNTPEKVFTIEEARKAAYQLLSEDIAKGFSTIDEVVERLRSKVDL